MDQENSINQAIVNSVMNREDVLQWLNFYGTLLTPSQRHSIKASISQLLFEKGENGYPLIYCFKTNFDIWRLFRFEAGISTIIVAYPLRAKFYKDIEYSSI